MAALAFGLLTRRLGLSPIIGYMVAGIFLGRHAAGFVPNYDIASELAEIGVILLMFGVGLQFNLKELLAVRAVAIPGALVQIALTTVLGAVTARGFGWPWGAGVLFGLSISVASTVVLTRILSDNNALHTQTGHYRDRLVGGRRHLHSCGPGSRSHPGGPRRATYGQRAFVDW